MSQKRQQGDGSTKEKGKLETNSPEDKRRRIPGFRNVVLEVMKRENIQRLESMIRKVVKEEVESALWNHVQSFTRTCGNDMVRSDSGSLRLKFLTTLSLPVFTGTRIEGEDGSPIRVALIGSHTPEVIRFDPLSSSKVEIVVLEGDFEGDEGESWTEDEFKNNIVKERDGKKPLLNGDLYFTLQEGMGVVGDISLTDNSSWTRSRKFRLGARLAGHVDGFWVREAITESFNVRDHRGELYKKHYPPTLCDEVWRLEKIGKDGAFHKRLIQGNIKTVKDFLIMLNLDPAGLRQVLGSGMSTKMWEVTVEHARTCVVDQLYLYDSPGGHPRKAVVFTSVAEVIGILTNGHYNKAGDLSETEKIEAKNLVILAFRNWDAVIPYDGTNSLVGSSSLGPTIIPMIDSPISEASGSSKIFVSRQISGPDSTQPSISSPDLISLYAMETSGSNYWSQALGILDESQPPTFPDQVPSSLFSPAIIPNLCDGSQFNVFDPNFLDPPHISDTGYPQSNLLSSILQPPPKGRVMKGAHRRWRMVFSVLQWFSILRLVVVKRSQGEEMPGYY